MEEALARFGQNVRAARKTRGWTQEELAERSGLAPVQISRIERGKREIRFSNLLRLTAALDSTADVLLTGVTAPGLLANSRAYRELSEPVRRPGAAGMATALAMPCDAHATPRSRGRVR